MAGEYVPNPADWVAKQVELYESTDGREGALLRGLPCIVITYEGRRSGATRKTALMTVRDGDNYVLVASVGGAPNNPRWYYNLLDRPYITVRDLDRVMPMRARLVEDEAERARLWALAVQAYPPYAEYQTRTTRVIPLFLAEPR